MTTLIRLLVGASVAVGGSSGHALGDAQGPWSIEYEPLVAVAIEPLNFEPSNGGVDLLPSISTAGMAGLQDSQPSEAVLPAAPSDWRFSLDATFWLPLRIKGTVTEFDTVTNVNIDLQTLLDDLKMIFEGGVTLTNDQWSFIFWSLYLNVDTDVKTKTFLGEFDTSLGLKAVMIDFAVTYRVAEWPLGDLEGATWSLHALGGFRYWNLDLEISERGPIGFDPNVSVRSDWFDPLVGFMLLFDISDKWCASFRGDIGGFGIGSASDLTWRLELLGYYAVSPNVDLVLGWRQLDFDWSSGGGRTGYDWMIYGPILGATIRF